MGRARGCSDDVPRGEDLDLKYLNIKVGDDVENMEGFLFRLIGLDGPVELTIASTQFDDVQANMGDVVNVPLVLETKDRLGSAQFRRIA